jgi:uncharacterized protein YndB with AHSA1/START domain
MSVSQDTSVQAQIVVDAPIERAFAVFTDDIGSWFPSEYNLLRALADVVEVSDEYESLARPGESEVE